MPRSTRGMPLMSAAFVLICFANITTSFFVLSDSYVTRGIGLMNERRCRPESCAVGHLWHGGPWFRTAGATTSLLLGITALLLLATVIRAAISARNGRVLGWVAFAFAVASLLDGVLFVARQPFRPDVPPLGLGFYSFLIGLLCAIAGTIQVALHGAAARRAEAAARSRPEAPSVPGA